MTSKTTEFAEPPDPTSRGPDSDDRSVEVVGADDLHGGDAVARQACRRRVGTDGVLVAGLVEAVGREPGIGLTRMGLLPDDRIGELLRGDSF